MNRKNINISSNIQCLSDSMDALKMHFEPSDHKMYFMMFSAKL